ncbi:MAG: hypothetical protein U0736_21840 [Gemmataceae bacterium]
MQRIDDGLSKRQQLAAEWPASRYADLDRDGQARRLLDEGRKRMGRPATRYAGLMLLQG